MSDALFAHDKELLACEADLQATRDRLNSERSHYIERGKALVRRERELADARRRIFRLEQGLAKIADPEVFDLDARAMRVCAQQTLSQELPPPGIW